MVDIYRLFPACWDARISDDLGPISPQLSVICMGQGGAGYWGCLVVVSRCPNQLINILSPKRKVKCNGYTMYQNKPFAAGIPLRGRATWNTGGQEGTLKVPKLKRLQDKVNLPFWTPDFCLGGVGEHRLVPDPHPPLPLGGWGEIV